jgi:hypothetical protein
MRRLALLFVTAAAMAGCTGTVETRGTIVASDPYEPDLVYVSPGVSVIADYDDSVFYADNFYWRNDGGRWYRSSRYNSGWVSYSSPPVAITRIERPGTYRHYRPTGYVRRDRARDNRRGPAHDHRRR